MSKLITGWICRIIPLILLSTSSFAPRAVADCESSCTSPEGVTKNHCDTMRLINDTAVPINAVMLGLDGAAASACAGACVDPMSPILVPLCTITSTIAGIADLSYSLSILANSDSEIEQDYNALNSLAGQSEHDIASTAVAGTALALKPIVGIGLARSGQGALARTAFVGNRMSKQTLALTRAPLTGRTQAMQKIVANPGVEATGGSGKHAKQLSRNIKKLRIFHCGTAALHLALVGIRTANQVRYANDSASACSEVDRLSASQEEALTHGAPPKENPTIYLAKIKNEILRSLTKLRRAVEVPQVLFSTAAYANELSDSNHYVDYFLKKGAAFIDLLERGELHTLPNSITSRLPAAALENENQTSEIMAQFPNLASSIKSGLQSQSVSTIVAGILPQEMDANMAEVLLNIAQKAQNNPESLSRLLDIPDLNFSNSMNYATTKPLVKIPNTQVNHLTQGSPLTNTNFGSRIEESALVGDYFHSRTSDNLFQIVSKRISIKSQHMQQKPY